MTVSLPDAHGACRWWRRGLAALIVVAALTGCQAPPTPEGWRRERVGWLRLAYPDEWQRVTAGIQGWTFGAGDAQRREQRTIEPLVNGRFSRDVDADAALARLEVPVFMAGLPDFVVHGSTELKVRGAPPRSGPATATPARTAVRCMACGSR